MAPIKRNAGRDFKQCAYAKKVCIVPLAKHMPTRCVVAHVRPAGESGQTPRSHPMVTRGISTRHSTAAVLDTYELLEAILKKLPMQELLEVRQVSKSWATVIKRSKPLRTKLFLEAEPRKCLWRLDRASLQLRPYECGARERLGEEWMQTQSLSRPSVVNPLLFSHDPILRSPLEIRALTCEGLYFKASPDLNKHRSIVHKMFITQPPVSVVQFKFCFHASKETSTPFSRADGFTTVRVVRKDGVKLGHMLAAFKAEASKTPQYGLGFNLSIKVCSSSPARRSVIWMLGAVFVDDEERELVEKFRKSAISKKFAEEPEWVGKVLCLEA